MHCVKSVYIPNFSGPYFPTFGLNTKRYYVPLRIQPECGKIQTRKTPNTDTFRVVMSQEVSHTNKKMQYQNTVKRTESYQLTSFLLCNR